MKGYIYRLWSKLTHKLGYHYAPPRPLPEPHEVKIGLDNKPIIEQSHWCTWCGLRGKTLKKGQS